MGEDADTVSTIQAFKTVADNPLTRHVLKALSKYCPSARRERGHPSAEVVETC